MAGYEPIGAGLASAGQSIAEGLNRAEDRKWREKAFEEQKRQFELGQANALKSQNMKSAMDLWERLGKDVESGVLDPEAANQFAPAIIRSAQTGEPMNFDAIMRLQKAQEKLNQPQDLTQPQDQPQSLDQQMGALAGPTSPRRVETTGEVEPFFSSMVSDVPAAWRSSQPRPIEEQSTPKFGTTGEVDPLFSVQVAMGKLGEYPGAGPLKDRWSPARVQSQGAKIFPTLYDRVSTVPNPKAVQVKALKPEDQIRLFREKPVNFDNAVKDGMEKGLATPADVGAYYEAKLLGKSDEELATIMKRMWREKPLSEDEKARLRQSDDALKVQNLRDYTEMQSLGNEMIKAAGDLDRNYRETIAKLEIEAGSGGIDPVVKGELFDEYTKQKEKIEKRLQKINQATTNLGHFIDKKWKLNLEQIPNQKEGMRFYQDRLNELTRRSAPAATVEQSAEQRARAEEQAAKETEEMFGFDVAKTYRPTQAPTEDERVDNEFDQLIEQRLRTVPDRNRAALSVVQELIKKYPNNEQLKAAQVELTNRLRQ